MSGCAAEMWLIKKRATPPHQSTADGSDGPFSGPCPWALVENRAVRCWTKSPGPCACRGVGAKSKWRTWYVAWAWGRARAACDGRRALAHVPARHATPDTEQAAPAAGWAGVAPSKKPLVRSPAGPGQGGHGVEDPPITLPRMRLRNRRPDLGPRREAPHVLGPALRHERKELRIHRLLPRPLDCRD